MHGGSGRRNAVEKYGALISALFRQHANLLLQFRTDHVSLQAFLARIGKAPTATCPTCSGTPEPVHHYLLACLINSPHRAVHLSTLGVSGRNLKMFLNSGKALRPLFSNINAAGRTTAQGAGCAYWHSIRISRQRHNDDARLPASARSSLWYLFRLGLFGFDY